MTRLPERFTPEERVERWPDAGRVWASMVLARHVDTCASILRGLPVRVGLLDRFVLRRALRGGSLPDPETYLVVTDEMLAAIREAGPIPAQLTRSRG